VRDNLESFLDELFDADDQQGETILNNLLAGRFLLFLCSPLRGFSLLLSILSSFSISSLSLPSELNVAPKGDDGTVGCWFCFKNVAKSECVSV
jgi:hypothetical protein